MVRNEHHNIYALGDNGDQELVLSFDECSIEEAVDNFVSALNTEATSTVAQPSEDGYRITSTQPSGVWSFVVKSEALAAAADL